MTSERLRARRLLNAASAILAAGVFADSATEHYRAGFHNRVMFGAPAAAGAAAAASTRAAIRSRAAGRPGSAALASAIIVGLAGFGFHLRNTARRVGGFTSSSNVFYGAPVAAPLAATLAGAFGLVASHLEDERGMQERTGSFVAALATLGLLGTTLEAGALHFRGAFQHPMMYAPVIAPPIAAATLATAALTRSTAAKQLATALLAATAAMGVAGTCFHAWGVHRRMGGWRNWRQNVFAGPPLPAPPAFTGLSLAGLAALALLESRDAR